ncbi:MAG TPA: hypothetical protein VK816_04745 [Jatrophihabitantaceae bacterium]|nr:hypothetical protein [Jatrophihabitantaceae bacterium]
MAASIATALALALALALAGCTGSTNPSGSTHPGGSAPSGSATPVVAATRWWQDPHASAGSTIDPAHPTAAAAGLHRDRSSYCGILASTLKTGQDVLAGMTATDPALRTSIRAWVAELSAVAPSPVAGPWQTLGAAILAMAGSGGSLETTALPDGLTPAAVSAAAAAIATDSRTACNLNLAAPS